MAITRSLDLLPAAEMGYRPLRAVDRLFDEWTRRFFDVEMTNEWLPAADIIETDDHYKVEVEAPGIDMKAIDVSFNDDILTIKGEKSISREEKETSYCSERYSGVFERRFRLPGRVNADKIDATYHDGVLKVVLPKSEKTKGKKITIH